MLRIVKYGISLKCEVATERVCAVWCPSFVCAAIACVCAYVGGFLSICAYVSLCLVSLCVYHGQWNGLGRRLCLLLFALFSLLGLLCGGNGDPALHCSLPLL